MDEFIRRNYEEENCILGHVHLHTQLLDVIAVNSSIVLHGFTSPSRPFQTESVS